MIANLTRGSGFRGLLNYLFQKGKEAVVVGGNMAGQTSRELSSEFAAVRQANDRVKTPVWHCSLSLPPGEDLTPHQWNAVGAALLAKLGLDQNRPWALVAHGDTEHKHVHLVTSRTAYDGTVWYGHWEVNNLLRAKSEVEREFGLQITPLNLETPKPTRGKLWEMSRAVEDGQPVTLSPKRDLNAEIDKAISESGGDPGNFRRKLAEAGVEVKLNQSKTTGRIAGASFRAEGADWFKGSQLGKDYTWAKISGRIAALSEQPHSPHETERITSGIRDDGVAQPGDQITPAGAANTPSQIASGNIRGDQPDAYSPIGSGPNDTYQPVALPVFSPIGACATGRGSAHKLPDAGIPDHRLDGGDPTIRGGQQPTLGVVLFDALTIFVSRVLSVIRGRLRKRRISSLTRFEPDGVPSRFSPEIGLINEPPPPGT